MHCPIIFVCPYMQTHRTAIPGSVFIQFIAVKSFLSVDLDGMALLEARYLVGGGKSAPWLGLGTFPVDARLTALTSLIAVSVYSSL